MIAGFTAGELVRALETTYYEDQVVLCTGIPGSFLHREPDMIICASGLPISDFNGVLGPRFGSGQMSSRVEFAMARFKRSGLPMRWLLGPSSSPSKLDCYLLRQGLVEEWKIPGMAIDPGTVKREPLPAGLDIHQIRDMRSLRDIIDVSAEAFEIPENARKGWEDINKRLWREDNIAWFLGVLHGKPVSTSLLVSHDEIASVYTVATLKEARGKGVGTAMTREPLLHAKNSGRAVAFLEASEAGLPVYQKLGFRTVCEFRSLAWRP
jgi:GNAT superfamily N-acetyltransferase